MDGEYGSSNARDGVRPFAVPMGIVGSVHDAFVSSGGDNRGQHNLTRLARNDHPAGAEKLARFDAAFWGLAAEYALIHARVFFAALVHLVHSFDPIGQTTETGFEPAEPEFGKKIDDTATNEGNHCRRESQRHRDGLGAEEMIEQFLADG